MIVKKIPWPYMVLTLQMVIITFFVIILSSFTLTAGNHSFINNKMFTGNVKGLNVKDDSMNLSVLTDAIGSKTVLYKYISEENQIKRAVYLSDDILNFGSYIEKGSFFTKEDCLNNLPLAVIGSDVLADTIEQDDGLYYGYNNTLYKVIGIFKKTDSDLDRSVYLNMSCIINSDGMEGTYYIDSGSADNVEQALRVVLERINASVFEYEQIQNDMNISHKIKFALSIVAAFCNLLMTAHYFILKQKYKMAVKKMCGYTNKRLIFKYSINISLVTIAAYIMGSALAVSLTRITLSFSESQFSYLSFLTALIIIFITGVIVTIQLVINASKVNISNVLKG